MKHDVSENPMSDDVVVVIRDIEEGRRPRSD
jgi:hypothetical protein